MAFGLFRVPAAFVRRHADALLAVCGLNTARRQILLILLLVSVFVTAKMFFSHVIAHGEVVDSDGKTGAPAASPERLRKCLSRSVRVWQDAAGDMSNFITHFHSAGDEELPLPYYGNGFVGASLGARFFQVAGVYAHKGAHSHLARIPNVLGTSVTVNGGMGEYLSTATVLDIRRGLVNRVTCFIDGTADDVAVEETWYAHRTIDGLMAHTLRVINNRQASVSVEIAVPPPRSEDIIATLASRAADSAGAGAAPGGDTPVVDSVDVLYGTVADGEVVGAGIASVAVAWNVIPPSIIVAGRRTETIRRLVAVVADIPRPPSAAEPLNANGGGDSSPGGAVVPDTLAEQAVFLCRKHFRRMVDGALLGEHESGWADLWSRGGVRFPDHVTLNGMSLDRLVNSTMYYIMSSLSPSRADSISPGGIAGGRQCYNEHVFWDAETWMLPAVQLFHPLLAEKMLDYRFDRLYMAEAKAATMGFKGAMFPWQSGATGAEVCPEKTHSDGEIHVVGDIAFAVRQQYYLSLDSEWLRRRGWPIVRGAAQFYASRVTEVPVPGDWPVYAINDVVPPDEYAAHVDNSVYTNAIAKITLEFAAQVQSIVNAVDDAQDASRWKAIAERLVIPYDGVTMVHPEYSGYSRHKVKQADAILLGFPLSYPMPPEVRAHDLEYYLERTDRKGPAMSASMFAVGYLALREKWEADYQLTRSFEVVDGRFNVWHEMPLAMGCEHFLTGAGGFLQALVYGYGGVRVFADHIRVHPTLPSSSHGIDLLGMRYASYVFDVSATDTKITVTLREQESLGVATARPPTLYVCEGACQSGVTPIGMGDSLSFERGMIHISVNASVLSTLRLPDLTYGAKFNEPQLPLVAVKEVKAPDNVGGTLSALFRDHQVAMVLIIVLVVGVHAVLITVVYMEYCAGGASEHRRKRKISDMEHSSRYE
eukprot:Opistho-2@74084